jgi:hypothetical protein
VAVHDMMRVDRVAVRMQSYIPVLAVLQLYHGTAVVYACIPGIHFKLAVPCFSGTALLIIVVACISQL